jgi:ubiquinone/menaquinone biosynthesis C-methylase UbiE
VGPLIGGSSPYGDLYSMLEERPADFWREPSAAERYEPERFHGLKGRLYRALEERAIGKALQMLKPGSTVLDAACGTGRITALLLKKEFVVRGCDVSFAMMSVARRQLSQLGTRGPLVQCDVGRLPFRDASFDAVTCIGLVMHLDNDVRMKVLQDLTRVSRRFLVLQYGRLDAFQRIKTRLTGRQVGNVRNPVVEAELRTDLQRAGLKEVARFWVLRPFSSSVVLLLSKRGE